jgi:hypothetical protein
MIRPPYLSRYFYNWRALRPRHGILCDCRVLENNRYTFFPTTTTSVLRQYHPTRDVNKLWFDQCKSYTIKHRQCRFVSYFEDDIDLTKSLIEIPKSEEEENALRSYLKIDLDQEFLETVNGIVSDFKVHFEEASRPTKNIQYNGEWATIIPLEITPLPIESLQSILLFDGHDTFCTLPPDKLIKYHQNLTHRLNKCGFLSNIDRPAIALPPGTPTSHWYIRIKEFKLAPQDKLNTIIAILQPSPFWKHLHKQIQGLASRTPGLFRTMTTDECNKWLPCIPVADVYNVMAGRTKYEILLVELLSKLPFDRINVSSKIQTISMGGTIPSQVPTLSWNFHFHGRPLLEIKERTDIQDSLPENFLDTSYDDDIMRGDNEYYNNRNSNGELDVDDITDDELIDDPLENYVIALEDIDFEPRADGTYRTYDDVDKLIEESKDMLTNEFDEETDTDDVSGFSDASMQNNNILNKHNDA